MSGLLAQLLMDERTYVFTDTMSLLQALEEGQVKLIVTEDDPWTKEVLEEDHVENSILARLKVFCFVWYVSGNRFIALGL